MTNSLSVDEKWELVKPCYEQAYNVVFKRRPDDAMVEFLYSEMLKLTASLHEHFKYGRRFVLRLVGQANDNLH